MTYKSVVKEILDNLIISDNCLLALVKLRGSLDQNQFVNFFKL